MSHTTGHVGHWEDLETWLSIATDSLLPKAAETLKHQIQDQLDDNITSLMAQDPSHSYNHKELAKITGSLSHTLIATLKLSDKHAAQHQQELTRAQQRIEQLERDQPSNTTAWLRQRGIWQFPRGTQACLRTAPWAIKDTTRTDLTPAEQNRVTCSWTDTWEKDGGGGVETFTNSLWRTLPHFTSAKRICCSQSQIIARLGPKRPRQARQEHWQIHPERAK